MKINEILESVKSGKISTSSAKKLLTLYSIEEVENFAKIDVNRSQRRGVPEVIFAETKVRFAEIVVSSNVIKSFMLPPPFIKVTGRILTYDGRHVKKCKKN